MRIVIYIIIFLSKVIENALATLRLIVVANGKKGLGAFLQFIISLVWVAVTGMVVIDIIKDPLKIVFFALGSWVGSYLGSYLEEKMALGNNMLLAVVNRNSGDEIADAIRQQGYENTLLESCDKNEKKAILLVMVERKKRKPLVNLIRQFDKKAMVVAENAIAIKNRWKEN